MRSLAAALFLFTSLLSAVAAEPARDWTWSESTCSAASTWLNFKGTATVVLTADSVVAELHDKEIGLRHRIIGKVDGGKVRAVLSTMNTDSGNVPMVGRYSRKVLREFSGAPVFEYITLTEGCSFIGLTRTTGGTK